MQRLQIARVLHACPALLVMDEATNAIEPALEAALLDTLTIQGIATVAMAQLDSRLRHSFNRCIHLAGDGSGCWYALPASS